MSARITGSLISTWLVCTLAMLLAMPVFSAQAETGGRYTDRKAVQAFIRDMHQRYGFSTPVLEDWLARAKRQDEVLRSIRRPAEHTLTWGRYRAIFLDADRIANGQAFLDRYRETFDRAEQTYGVSRYVVAAIIGVETRYGRVAGDYRVLDALATLAFDYPPRGTFFRSELGQFFLMVREQGLDPLRLKGSYAGAMGYGQFIASSYRHYAVDFNGDKVADIIDSPEDAIGSVAHYFARHGWQTGQPVASRMPRDDAVSPGSPLLTSGLKPALTMADFRKQGLAGDAGVADAQPTRALRLDGSDGDELWLTYRNFYVITRYNHSPLYAMAVHQLAQALRKAHG